MSTGTGTTHGCLDKATAKYRSIGRSTRQARHTLFFSFCFQSPLSCRQCVRTMQALCLPHHLNKPVCFFYMLGRDACMVHISYYRISLHTQADTHTCKRTAKACVHLAAEFPSAKGPSPHMQLPRLSTQLHNMPTSYALACFVLSLGIHT